MAPMSTEAAMPEDKLIAVDNLRPDDEKSTVAEPRPLLVFGTPFAPFQSLDGKPAQT